MDDVLPSWNNFFRPEGRPQARGTSVPNQKSLFNIRVSTVLPAYPIGQDLAFVCIGDDGRTYYCKSDRNGFPIRATEWIATQLANHLGLSVADAVVLENNDGATFFGSRAPFSLAAEMQLGHFFNVAAKDELGRPSQWLGRFLAQIWAFDIFIDNPDRNLRNFILDQDGQMVRLRAIDFASARFLMRADTNFPIASESTSIVGRIIRTRHGAHREAGIEMLDRIDAIPSGVIAGILSGMPDDWLLEDQIGRLIKAWSDDRLRERTAKARALIEHDWNI